MPVMESKAADVFAFAMFAVEVFTGKIPFEEQKNEAVVLRISRGGRPEMPANAQAVGLTAEMWKLLESCWNQSPKKRPAMDEVVRRWRKFVENINDNFFPEEPQPAMGSAPGTSRSRARSEAVRPQTRSETTRLRTRSEAVQPRTKDESIRLRPMSGIPQSGSRLEPVQQGTKSEVIQPQAPPSAPLPNVGAPKSKKKWWACGLF